jgi:hypothetical protein
MPIASIFVVGKLALLMPQFNLYVNDELAERIRQAADDTQRYLNLKLGVAVTESDIFPTC